MVRAVALAVALLALAAGSLALLPRVDSVRALARLRLERLLDDVLLGRVEIDRLDRLSLGGATATGVTVTDASGQTVLRAAQVELGFAPLALLRSRLHFTHGVVDGARVRLVPGRDAAVTLFEALSPASDPEAPNEAGGLDVWFDHLHVRASGLYGEVPGVDQLSLRELEARGSIRVTAGVLSVAVSQLRGALLSPLRRPAAIEQATFTLQGDGARMAGRARLARGAERARLSFTLAGENTDNDRLDLRVAADALSPELLEELGVEPAEALLSSVGGYAQLQGELDQLSLRAALTSDAGPIVVSGSFPASGLYEVRIGSPDLALERLLAYAPQVHAQVQIEAAAQPSGAVRLRLSAPTAESYGVRFQDIDVEASYAAARLTIGHARLRYGPGWFDISGFVDADANLSLRVRSRVPEVAREAAVRRLGVSGSLRTDIRIERQGRALQIEGSLGTVAPAYGGFQAKELVLEGSVRTDESFASPELQLTGASWGSQYLGRRVGDIEFRVRGKSPHFSADFDFIDNRARTAVAHVEVKTGRAGHHVVLWPLEIGVLGREPWRARADLTIGAAGASLHEVFLVNGPQRLTLSGHYDVRGESQMEATLQSFDLGGLRALSGLELADLDGTIDARLSLSGTPESPRIDAQGSVHSGVFLGMSDLTLLLSLRSLERRFDLDAELVLPDQSRLVVYAGGEPGTGPDWATQIGAGNYQFGIDFQRVPFEVGRPWLGWLGLTPPAGTISATLRGAGTLAAPSLEAKAQVHGLGLRDLPPFDLELDLGHDGKRASLRTLRAADREGEIARLSGFLEASLAELLDPLTLRRELASRPLELTASWRDRRLDALPPPFAIALPMRSSGLVQLTQTERGPALDLAASAGGPGRASALTACGAERHPSLALSLRAHDLRTTAKLTAHFDGDELAMADLEADTPIVAWLVGEQPLYLPRTSFTLDASSENSEDIPGLCEHVAGPLRVEISGLDAFAEPPELRVQVRSPGLQVVASGREGLGALREVRTLSRPFAVDASAHVDGPRLLVHSEFAQPGGSELTLALSLPRAALGFPKTPRASWPLATLEVTAQRAELASLLMALPVAARATGALEGRARAEYDFARDHIDLEGAFSIEGGRVALTGLGQELSDLRARVIMYGNTVRLENFAARDFEGRLAMTGELTLLGLEELRSELELRMTDFPIRRESAQVSRLTGTARLRATSSASRTRAELTFGELRVNLPNELGQELQPLDEHRDIVVRGQAREQAPKAPYQLELRVLAASPPIRVLRSDLSAEIGADLTLRYQAPSLTLQGSAEVKRGSFEVYGRRFELGESRLAFDGGEEIDPLVSLDATHKTGGDEIGIRVEGRLSTPRISFTHSDPSITEPGDIIAQLLGAKTNDSAADSDEDATGAAAGILAGATAGLLTQEVRREFGGALPVLSLESSSQSLRDARIRAGVQLDQLIERRLGRLRRIVRGAYVEGFVAPGAHSEQTSADTQPQSRAGGLLELRFPRDLVGTVEYRPYQNWRLDIAWEP